MHEIVVTGSSSGIGAALVRALQAEGRRVIGVAHDHGDVVADLSTDAGRALALREVLTLSGGVLDGLVCSAGLGPGSDPAQIVSVNYFGSLALLDGLLEALRAGRTPAAVLMASTGAVQVPDPDAMPLTRAMRNAAESDARAAACALGDSMFVYCLSKYALTCAMRERAAALAAAGVRINAVAPGPTETPMLAKLAGDERLPEAARSFVPPVGRCARPEEIADFIRYLLSPRAGFIHGSLLFIDGGIDALTRPHRF